ncbi:MAG: RagB/SusD protein [Adhaeribacter sp.]|nr:RagB/SusD protein [Adhaeribacter sp.]
MRHIFFQTYKYLALALTGLFLFACELEELPADTANKAAVFGSENGLQLYTNSFYEWMPSANTIHQADAISDYSTRRNAPDFLRDGNVYSSRSADNTSASGYDVVALGNDFNWGWGALRNINYFLDNNKSTTVPADARRHYNGIAKFFRAWFYFEKVQRYGDVPFINKALDVTDEKLYSGRDPRTLVMDSVLADINYAIANIRANNEGSRTLITKDVALALKSRIALFEGTFRKYHTDKNLPDANKWLNEAAAAAQTLVSSNRYSLYKGTGTDQSYRQVFSSEAPIANEVILSVVSSTALNVRHAANWYFTSSTTGTRFNFIRPFIHTYLKIDGTPFTSDPGYATKTFMDEVKGRDKRLAQTIRAGSYKRVNANGTQVAAPPTFTYTYTGYQPIKWTVDNVAVDGGSNNTNAVAIFRYAEVLLNLAEAKAELGTITAADWAKTVGDLRSRAGITGGLTTLPTVLDPYMKVTYFPNITDPVLMEIRRERGIELALEGLRFYDIVRWKRGELFEMPYTGIYVPEANKFMDLNEDGTNDVYFYTVAPASQVSGVTYVNVNTASYKLTNGTSGELLWLPNIARKWEGKKYFYPVPETHLLTNPSLGQNPGW